MWACKHCGKEVWAFMDINEAGAIVTFDKHKNIKKTELLAMRDWTGTYQCSGCGKIGENNIESIAKWTDEEEMDLRKELKETLVKLDDLSRAQKTLEVNLQINALNTYVDILQLRIVKEEK